LVVSSYGGLGGAELALETFIAHRPGDVDVHALLVSGGPLEGRLRAHGVPVTVARGFDGRPGPARIARFTRAGGAALREWAPDVVWAVGQKAALLMSAPARLRRTPLVWHKVDFSWDRTLARPLALAASGVVGCSDAVLGALGGLRERRALGVVYPPVALPDDLRARPDPERAVIGTLGRLAPYKGHHHIVRAAAELAAEFPELSLVLAGGDEPQYAGYRESLTKLAADLGIADRVELPGHVAPASVLERLNVFVSATYRDEQGFGLEGFGSAVLEAGWAGVPAVAVAGGGMGEALEDGVTGTLVGSADPTLLAEATARYLRDPELAERTGRAGAERARTIAAPSQAAEQMFRLLKLGS
jgi:glycosyltransferase involved in cell wall biosynthesis